MNSNFFGVRKGKVLTEAAEDEERKPTSAHHWLDYAARRPSARQVARSQKRSQAATTRRYNRQQRALWRQKQRFNEKTAVTVLRAYENELGYGPGDLRAELIEEGKLEATRPKIVGWQDEVREVDGEFIDVKAPITRQVPIGHTAAQILDAAGLDEAAIQEINERATA